MIASLAIVAFVPDSTTILGVKRMLRPADGTGLSRGGVDSVQANAGRGRGATQRYHCFGPNRSRKIFETRNIDGLGVELHISADVR